MTDPVSAVPSPPAVPTEKADAPVAATSTPALQPLQAGAVGSELRVRADGTAAWEAGNTGLVTWGLAAVLLVVSIWALRRNARGYRSGPPLAGASPTPWLLRTWRSLPAGRPQSDLRVLHSARLTPRASVHVVAWRGSEWLVGCGDDSVALLGQHSTAAEPASPPGPSA